MTLRLVYLFLLYSADQSYVRLTSASLICNPLTHMYTDLGVFDVENSTTHTTCKLEPLPAFGISYHADYSEAPFSPELWNTVGQIKRSNEAMLLQIPEQSTVEWNRGSRLRSKFYILYGRVELVVRATPGPGLLSYVLLRSDESHVVQFFFAGNNRTHIFSNYYTPRQESRVHDKVNPFKQFPLAHSISTAFTNLHRYTLVWTPKRLEWWCDNTLVRHVSHALAIPRVPMAIELGIFAVGDVRLKENLSQWVDRVNYSQGPFTMSVKSLGIHDFTPDAREYVYANSPRYRLRRIAGESLAAQNLRVQLTRQNHGDDDITTTNNDTGEGSDSSHVAWWWTLSDRTRIAMLATGGGLTALIITAFAYFCMRQRRIGKREKAIADAKFDRMQQESLLWRRALAVRFRRSSHPHDKFTFPL